MIKDLLSSKDDMNDLYAQNGRKIDPKYLDKDEIAKRIVDREDIIGRNDKFKKIDLDNSFPEYLIKNLNNFKDWIV